jgi:hypothetical protein
MVFQLICKADYNQAAECLPVVARGRQCVPCSFVFLITVFEKQSCEHIYSDCLNNILCSGSQLYCDLYQTAHLGSDFIDPIDMPKCVTFNGSTVNIKHMSVISGSLETYVQVDNINCYNLEVALTKANTIGKYYILVFSNVSIGVYFDGTVFYIFDSHSRNNMGMSCPNGKCVLGVVQSSEICAYIRLLATSLGTNRGKTQFDIHIFSLCKSRKRKIVSNSVKIPNVCLERNLHKFPMPEWCVTECHKRRTERTNLKQDQPLLNDVCVVKTACKPLNELNSNVPRQKDHEYTVQCNSAKRLSVAASTDDLHEKVKRYEDDNHIVCNSQEQTVNNNKQQIRKVHKKHEMEKRRYLTQWPPLLNDCGIVQKVPGITESIHSNQMQQGHDNQDDSITTQKLPVAVISDSHSERMKRIVSRKSFRECVDDRHIDVRSQTCSIDDNSGCSAFTITPQFVKNIDSEMIELSHSNQMQKGHENQYESNTTQKCPVVVEPESSSDKVKRIVNRKSLRKYVDDCHVNVTLQSCSADNESGCAASTLIPLFVKSIKAGPNYVCSCCTQTFFGHCMKAVNRCREANKYLNKFLTKYKSVDNIEWICRGCFTSAKAGKTPKFWIENGLQFPNIPFELRLSNLEERLVSPRLPFMQLREMPRGGQINLKGNIVNVPADVNSTIKSLPRMIDENQTIMLKLKRKLSYKHHVAFENIRPNKVFEAAKWLVGNSDLFKSEGIVLNETWLSNPQQFPNTTDNVAEDDGVLIDDWTEDDNFIHRPTGNLDTCLQSLDFREFNKVLSVAPGENNLPIGLFQDIHSEALSFPSIFCGHKRVVNTERLVSLHYSDICKWELRNVDRRAAECVPNIFYKLKRLQIKQIKDKVSLAIRKCKLGQKKYTARDFLSPGFVDQLTMQNDGYKVLRTLRGSPPYWESAKKDVFAMIRQLGIPTWFCSFSAAETKWEPLLISLAKLGKGIDLSAEQVEGLSWQEKSKLIKSDPVTCARYFDHRVQSFINLVLKHQSRPIGNILDFFYRVEFQQRGSPHIHMIMWIKDAPVHGVSSDRAVAIFVDKYITCCNDESIPILINYQTHRHAQTCKKGGKKICRFNFPVPPMPETVVLHPLDKTCKKVSLDKYNEMISTLNDAHKADSFMSFDDFLVHLDMDYETYIHTIRSTLTRPKVYLKRSMSESRINNYNTVLLTNWKANMDIQYVLDPYSCVSYIVSYIAKGQRGLSNLLQDACQEARETDSDVRQQVRRIGNQFLSSVEIGAQEAVYLVLQLPLRRCTRQVVYVDTKKQNDRTCLIKSFSELKDLPANSKSIETDNVLKRYKRRPKNMENLCYADFASWYDLCRKPKPDTPIHACTDSELPETCYAHDEEDALEIEEDSNEYDGKVIMFPCGTHVRKRTKQKVIYSQGTSMNNDKEEHFREKLMLYTHWRDDEKDLIEGCESYEQIYHAKLSEISANKLQYEHHSEEFYKNIIDDMDSEQLESAIHPEAQHQNLLDSNEVVLTSDTLGCFHPGVCSNTREDYDLGEDLGISRNRVCDVGLPQKEITNNQYLQSVQILNQEQKRFFYHILNKVKMRLTPFYTFLSGGAGCGKSVLIRAINQALLKYFNHQRWEYPDSLKLLLCAPTGKAAHNIGGSTIHAAFCIPANQGFHFKPLDMQQLNTLRSRYHDLKVVIIDEISMVGRAMLNFVNLRLQEIKGCTQPFGNVSILAVGDLFQLKPVLDAWVFSQEYNTPQLECIGTNLWTDLFDFYELKEIMRQKDDHAFALLLNRLREGLQTEEDMVVLENRTVSTSEENNEIKLLPHLFCTRANAQCHNDNILSNLPSADIINVEAIDCVSGNISTALHDKILSKLPLDPTRTMGLQKNLVVGIGMPAELCSNIDTEDGMTNGAACTIRKFDHRVENSNRCSIIWVEFENETIAKKWHSKYRHLYQQGIPATWIPVMEICRRFSFRHYKTYQIVRRQFPLYMSAGKTIHKSQGSTITSAVMHFGFRKIDHIHYVGLSRVTSLSGVNILELNSTKISISSQVKAEMERLRIHRQIQENLPDMKECRGLTVCFHNCRSLQKHIDDIKHDHNLLCADLIGFVESRVSDELTGRYEIDGFKVLSSTWSQSSHGIAIYHKENIQVQHFEVRTCYGIEYALLSFVSLHFVIGFVYCPPKFSTVTNFAKFLSEVFGQNGSVNHLHSIHCDRNNVVLMGDFNFNYPSAGGTLTGLFNDRLALRQLVKSSTTDYDSCLDHIYTNLPNEKVIECGTLESYYSDHKPLYLSLNQ